MSDWEGSLCATPSIKRLPSRTGVGLCGLTVLLPPSLYQHLQLDTQTSPVPESLEHTPLALFCIRFPDLPILGHWVAQVLGALAPALSEQSSAAACVLVVETPPFPLSRREHPSALKHAGCMATLSLI